MKPWMVVEVFDDDDEEYEETHVIPVGDTREHEPSCDCWCRPRHDTEDPDIVIHHSADGRELSEFHSTTIH